VQLSGDRPLLFRLPGLGRVAVLICLDAEDAQLRDEVIRLGARVVINPIHIPATDGAQPQWQVALDAMGENFSHVCNAHRITWLRCDLPFPHGMGSSQAVGAELTHRAASMDCHVLPVLVYPPPGTCGHIPLLVKVPDNSRERDRREQNCGARCTVSSLLMNGQVIQIQFCNAAALNKKVFATMADQSVAVVDVSNTIKIEKISEYGTDLHSQTQAAILATEASQNLVPGACGGWLDLDEKYFLRLDANGGLEFTVRGSDGNMRRPLVVPTAERITLLSADRRDGTIVTVSSRDGDGNGSKISYWHFTHNCIPAPLSAFLAL